MILVTTTRFRAAIKLPGGRVHSVISTERQADARDFRVEYDPRLRLLFVEIVHGEGKGAVMGYPMEQIEYLQFDPASFAAFREADPVKAALAQRRKDVQVTR